MNKLITLTLNPALDKTVKVSNFELGTLNRIQNPPQLDPGGKGINVAKVLHQFNSDVVAAGLIAGDSGKKLQGFVEQMGISTQFLEIDGEVRTNLKIIDEASHIVTELNEPGFIVLKEDVERLENRLSDLLDSASLLILSGSLPQGLEETTYAEMIKLANERGVKTILDADGNSFKHGILAKPFAIKPNLFELEQYANKSLHTFDEMVHEGKKLLHQGIELVVISLGEDGAIFLSEEQGYHVKPFSIKPKSTVGAGDSMVAVIAYGYEHHFSLIDTAKWATTAGTITATKEGTTVCTLEEVKNAVAKVQTLQLY